MSINLFEIFSRQKKLILTLVFVFLLFGVISFGARCYFLDAEVKALNQQLENRNGKAKIVSFLNLFIEKVLQTSEDISFEDRLKLENAVRDINDPEILSLWEAFTKAETAEQVQVLCKNLLEALAKKLL